MNNANKILSALLLSISVFISGCDDKDDETNAPTVQYSQQADSPAQSQPTVVVVDSGINHANGPSMGDVMLGSALGSAAGTMVGNHLSKGSSDYRTNDNRYNSRTTKTTTIINNYNTPKPSGLSLTKPENKPVKSFSSLRSVTKTYRPSSRRR